MICIPSRHAHPKTATKVVIAAGLCEKCPVSATPVRGGEGSDAQDCFVYYMEMTAASLSQTSDDQPR